MINYFFRVPPNKVYLPVLDLVVDLVPRSASARQTTVQSMAALLIVQWVAAP